MHKNRNKEQNENRPTKHAPQNTHKNRPEPNKSQSATKTRNTPHNLIVRLRLCFLQPPRAVDGLSLLLARHAPHQREPPVRLAA